MEAIVAGTSARLVEVLSGWDTVDTVTVLTFGSDRYDPSFFISADVYHHGMVPVADEREQAFSFAAAFESSVDGRKDRFLIDELPVRLEYKPISDVDRALGPLVGPESGDALGSTYGFYRLQHAEIAMNRSNWLEVVRRQLSDVPEEFWVRRIDALRARMEHALGDLTSAVYAEEDLFYHLSLASFTEQVCQLLMAVNRRFDPPGRRLRAEIMQLSMLPEEFTTRFEYLLGDERSFPRARKRQIAELLARSLLSIA